LGADKVYQYDISFVLDAHRHRFTGRSRRYLKSTSLCPKQPSSDPHRPGSHGHAIQLLGAIAAIANDGVYMQPYVVKYIKDDKDQSIKEFSPKVVAQVITRKLLKDEGSLKGCG